MKKITEFDYNKIKKSNPILFKTQEYSKVHNCLVKGEYYYLGENRFAEHVTRQYDSYEKEAFFTYEIPYPVLYTLIHCADKNLRRKADSFASQYIKTKRIPDIDMPVDIHEQISALAHKFNCSFNTMLENLLYQGLASEVDTNTFYEDYEL